MAVSRAVSDVSRLRKCSAVRGSVEGISATVKVRPCDSTMLYITTFRAQYDTKLQ